MLPLQLLVFDMAGTTVRDQHEVEACFAQAAAATGLQASAARILAVQGQAKRFVFDLLWREQLGPGASETELTARVDHSYQVFRNILENHYRTAEVLPTEGCLDLFAFLKSQGIRIALTTGFYREVTDLILRRLGWHVGLDAQHRGTSQSLIDLSIASDEVAEGRPAPLMIQRAMQTFGITDPRQVWNVGDTPSDLVSGRRAVCARSLGVTNGTHSVQQLANYPNDGLLASLTELHQLLRAELVTA
ncbi:phosphonatase-like hydrolase [Hymenobacter ginsengisoli]|uniref:Phosphonatase-like hydrolase n=1 Tax=Hymenobacter ginsengisoli TaxID=1051626 RepID=A0ABP8QC97_9BACT|nr:MULTISPECIES: HAD family hydrolase [unclassified Hymenobacter]MBO2031641.1 HAD hydrolase-like protein [Hymenobacter sp. BT559]